MRRERKKKKKNIRYLTGQQKKIRDTIRLARTVLSKQKKMVSYCQLIGINIYLKYCNIIYQCLKDKKHQSIPQHILGMFWNDIMTISDATM